MCVGIMADPSCSPGPDDENIARNGDVYPSSENIEGAARKVIDGNKDTDYRSGSCFETSYEKPAWWVLDLKESYKIDTIIVVNRGDCCAERLMGAEVRVAESLLSTSTRCGTITDVRSPQITLCCDGMVGRYITIIITGRKENLTLCEVEVYGVSVNDRTVCE
ncbi:pentraxin fusion protein-like [Ascaphus truei]|uniref:pentraxin fusion protein-like n=1 Tax=Ascaphus truei TaxID=8439 RepID=UPI003F5A93AF